MEIFIAAFLAGALTILAPCVLPLLPVIIGGSLAEKSFRRPIVITASLAASLVIFTLLLKASTAFIAVPPSVWKMISGGIILFFGFITLFPTIWEKITMKIGFGNKSQTALQKASKKSGIIGEIALGAALGPVFASCSPTYFLILAAVLPVSFAAGVLDLIAYAAGLSVVMLAIAFLGQKFLAGAKWAADPHGLFKKILGVLFLIVGVAILTGLDKKLEKFLLDRGYGVTTFETQILEKIEK